MDKINTVKNNTDESSIGNSKQPLIHTMSEDIETLKHNLSKAKPAPKNLPPKEGTVLYPPKDLPIASPASPAPVKKPQALSESPFVPFANKQKPETGPQKPSGPAQQKTIFVRPENNLPPIVRLARQKAPASANLIPKEQKTPTYRPASPQLPLRRSSSEASHRGEQAGLAGVRPQTNPQAPGPSAFKKILTIVFLAAFAFFAYYFLRPVLNKPAVVLPPPAEIPDSLVADAKNMSVSADFNSGLMFSVRKYLEDNKNRTDVYGASRLIIKNIAGTEILKIENLKDFLGVNLPTGFLGAVDKNYSLLAFDYPKNNYLRLGLVFKIVKPEIIGQEASSWEPKIFGDLSPLLLGAPAFYDPAKNFGSNTYLGASVRYLSLGEARTALNYAIDKNKTFFLIATSKEDIYYLIEKTAKNQ